MAIKRKAPAVKEEQAPPLKAARKDDNQENHAERARVAEKYGLVQRQFYPPLLTEERCKQYLDGTIPRPIEVLTATVKETASARAKVSVGGSVVHWFKRDLRLRDNRSLHLAAEKAKENNIPLICMFIVSPQDYQAHLTSPARVDFELRTLQVLKEDLAALDIPLYVETVEQRKTVPAKILALTRQWKANHVFCNIEYEVDELRREEKLTRLFLDNKKDLTPVHDDVIVSPGSLQTGAGRQFSVYSPWFRAWVAHVHNNPKLLDEYPPPTRNPSSTRKQLATLFDSAIPSAPKIKRLESDEVQKRLAALWPAGEHEAEDRLEKFIQQRIGKYKDTRNLPAAATTSSLSVHLSVGTLAARTAVRRARDANKTKNLDGGIEGIKCWISEVAWRDFYKHVLANWPFVCMNMPWKYEYSRIVWDYDEMAFDKWCRGQTGFPIVDAAMRQMRHTGYMHNRCRMIVACFLAKDLLIDWRMGEKFFMEMLIDGDFASNNGGWGFSSSCGVDPQPYFRIFNPLLQSEKFDPDGEYIRKWVPELKNVQGKAIHDPYGRGAAKDAERNKYPRPMVDHSERRKAALERYKSGIGRDTA